MFPTLCLAARLNANQFVENMGNKSKIRRGDALFVTCLAESAIDNLVDFHGANKDVDGPEKQVRGSIGVGGKAADLEPEQGYRTL